MTDRSIARVEKEILELADLARSTTAQSERIVQLATLYADTLKSGATIYFAGNGGSAADAQHLATEYVVRYTHNRRAFAAVALTTDTSLLTAVGNDLSFELIFARQVEALCRPGDLLVLHSTSGQSPNLLCAAETARRKGIRTAALLGKGGGPLAALVDHALVVDSASTSHIQEMQLAIEHIIAGLVQDMLLEGTAAP